MHGMLGKRRAYGITFEGMGNSVQLTLNHRAWRSPTRMRGLPGPSWSGARDTRSRNCCWRHDAHRQIDRQHQLARAWDDAMQIRSFRASGEAKSVAVALMFNPDSVPYFDVYLRSFKALPQQTSVEVEAVRVRSAADVELAVAKLSREPGSALIAASDAFILAVRGVILKAADQYRCRSCSTQKALRTATRPRNALSSCVRSSPSSRACPRALSPRR
jgi:hypothetical protein